MNATTPLAPGALPARLGWWLIAIVCAVYGAWALSTGLAEVAFLLGSAPEEKHRATPLIFTVHALAGAVALLAGPLQFHPRIRRHRRVHRSTGLAYVGSVWLASSFAILDALAFAVSVPSKAVFTLTASAWFAITTVAFFRARARDFGRHREWMIRSFALSLFAVTFSLWVPVLAGTPLPRPIAYPLALTLSGTLNLAVAEWWIRHTRCVEAKIRTPESMAGRIPVVTVSDSPSSNDAGPSRHTPRGGPVLEA
jgi:hypothetical protein